MNKLGTWWRYKSMEMRAFLYQSLDLLEWPIRLAVNWAIFLTLWIWVGFAYMVFVLVRAIQEKKCGERDAINGKIWWWKQYKLY